MKTNDGAIKGKISLYCRVLDVSREGFRKHLKNKDKPWKYKELAIAIQQIIKQDECNDTYGRIRMYQAIMQNNSEIGFVNISWHIFRKDFTLMLLKLMPHNTFAV